MANNRVAYGLAKQAGIDTTGMSPAEVWEVLKKKGITVKTTEETLKEYENLSADELKAVILGKQEKAADTKAPLSESNRRETRAVKFNRATPRNFQQSLLAAKQTVVPEERWRVADDHTEEDYAADSLFVTEGGSTVAVTPKGDIISVCKNQTDKGVHGRHLLEHAVSEGGDRLDAFGERLYNFYTRNGFEAVSWTSFNREYAPHDWKPEYGEEPIIFYKYTGKSSNITYNEFIINTQKSNDYDSARESRDKAIRGNKT